jgi:CspA family cold shock protein
LDVPSGTVKFFHTDRGFGFIGPDDGGKDVFVHISAVERSGLRGLREGAKVTFDVVESRGKPVADNLRVK